MGGFVSETLRRKQKYIYFYKNMSFLLGSTGPARGRRHGAHSHSHGGHGHGHGNGGGHKHDENCSHHKQGDGGRDAMLPAFSRVVPTKDNVSMADLYRAVDAGDLPLTHYIVTRLGMNVNVKDPVENTPIHTAARRGWVNVAKYLAEAGCGVNDMNNKGQTPLMWAVTNGHLAMVQTLVSLGADINTADRMGFTATIHAAQSGHLFVLHYLLSTGVVDVNAVDNDGHTALCWACYNGHLHLIEYLLQPRLCPSYTHLGILDKQGKSVLHWAAAQGHIPVIHRLLLAHCESCQSGGLKHPSSSSSTESLSSSSSSLSSSYGDTTAEPPKCSITSGEAMLRLRDAEGNTPAQCATSRNLPLVAKEIERSSVGGGGSGGGGGGASNGVKGVGGNPDVYTRELVAQVASGFLPHFITMFYAVFVSPWWAVVLCVFLSFWVHGSGILKWTIPQRTLIPAGIMFSALCLMLYVCLYINLSSTKVLLIYIGVAWISYTYYSLHLKDPGVIHHSESDLKKALDLATHGMEPSSDYCRTCRIIKPPRTKHCRPCGTCTARHDHHCVWIYNCVALKNNWLFYNFLWSIVLTLVPFEWWSFSYIRQTAYEGETIVNRTTRVFTEEPQIAWSMIFYLLVLIPVSMLAFHHTRFLASDMTTYEMITHKPQSKNKFSLQRYIAFIMRGTDVFVKPEKKPQTYASAVV
eukprot:TRINITY_DN1200_c0_g1_i1.p1 TRINITY_DN1200_c0_g1~~TRINITY_DN1200_c0_g1_i1.p1  ORF type:complete len:693 (+),score=167.52 TRINITY_DN1200_c0_g1_i1:24-2102(+)